MMDKNDIPDDGSGPDQPGENPNEQFSNPLDFLRKMFGEGNSKPGGFFQGMTPPSGGPQGANPGGVFIGGPFFDPSSQQHSGDDTAGNGGIFAMMQQMGDFISGVSSSLRGKSEGAINVTAARNAAIRQLGADPSLRDGQRRAVEDSVRLSDMWLDEVTTLPSGVTRVETWVPRTWVENSLATWCRLLSPVVDRMNKAGVEALPPQAAEQLSQFTESMGGIMNIVDAITSYSFGSQLGDALGQMSKEITCSSELGIPLDSTGVAALLPMTIETLSKDLELPQRDVLIFLAAREAAYQRLWKHVPWLAPRLLGAVQDYANGIVIDYSSIEAAASEMAIDPEVLSDPQKLAEAMSSMQGAQIIPEVHYTHTAALVRLETMLALLEGWVDVVVMAAIGHRIPSVPALSEMWRRRRATASPAEEALKSSVGLELRPRRVRDAVDLWTRITDAVGTQKRDDCWAHPDLLPTADDLDNPAGCLDRLLDDDRDSFDADWAALEQSLNDADKSGNTPAGNDTTADGDAGSTIEGGDDPSTSEDSN